ncbi:uncharacterized protein LOC135834863 [Planococcus citri]|uniref:uncharacterized protein LOC135834863 n=1 Tax=Planococcus citri TaxID=170843 RepID=UPI0031F9897A
MSPPLWVKTGFQICIFVSFLLFAMLAISTALLHFHLSKQRDVLLEKINETETHAHGEIYPTPDAVPTIAPFPVIPTMRNSKKANTIIPKAPDFHPSQFKHSGLDQRANPQTDPVSFDENSDVYAFKNDDVRLNIDPQLERETVFGDMRKENWPNSMKAKEEDPVGSETSSTNIDSPIESDLRPNEKPVENRSNVQTHSEDDSESENLPKQESNPFADPTPKYDLESKLKTNATAIFPNHDIVTRSSNDSEIDSLIEKSAKDSEPDMSGKNETLGNDDSEMSSAGKEMLPDLGNDDSEMASADKEMASDIGNDDSEMASAGKEMLPDLPPTDMRPHSANTAGSDPPAIADGSDSKQELHERLPTPFAAKALSSADRTINNNKKFHSKINSPSKNVLMDSTGSLLKIARDLNAHHSSIEEAAKIMQRLKRSVPISPSFHRNGVKSRKDAAFNRSYRKSQSHSVPVFKNVLKSSFVGYPAFYGLWSKGSHTRNLVQHRESLHQSEEDLTGNNNAHPLSMTGILKEMMALKRSGAKIGKPDENHPLYRKKYRLQFANPLPQEATTSPSTTMSTITTEASEITTTSMSTMQAGDTTSTTMSTMKPGDITTLPSDMTTMSMSTMKPGDMTTMSMSTMMPSDMSTMSMSTMMPGDTTTMSMSTMMPGDTTTMSMSTMTPGDMSTMSPMTTTCRDDDPSEEIIDPERDPSEENIGPEGDYEEGSEEFTQPDRYPSEESDEDYGEGGSCNGPECVDCSDMNFRKLHSKLCSKKAARDTLKDVEVPKSEEKHILKKIDAIAKRNVGSVNRIQKSEHEQGSMKSNLDSSLFSILAPRRKILRNTLQDDGTIDAE